MTRGAWALIVLSLSCESSEIDGGDLRGVFEEPSAAPTVTAPALAKSEPTASARAEPRIPARTRPRVAGRCLPDAGEPAELGTRVAKRPACRGARILEARDEGRVPRYGCVYEPSTLAEAKPLPLIVFFHGEHDDPSAVHKKTRLRRDNHVVDLTGDPRHRGFIVLAPQARRLKNPKKGEAVRWDTAYTAAENDDLETVDQLVDGLLDEGIVDSTQIYALGHGGGGTMAALYAHARPDRVAAFGVFGAAPRVEWSCEGEPTPAAVVYRACDAVTPCADVEQWLSARERGGAPTFSLRLGVDHSTEPSCALSDRACSDKKGQANHHRWPRTRERELLEYLGRFSLAGDSR